MWSNFVNGRETRVVKPKDSMEASWSSSESIMCVPVCLPPFTRTGKTRRVLQTSYDVWKWLWSWQRFKGPWLLLSIYGHRQSMFSCIQRGRNPSAVGKPASYLYPWIECRWTTRAWNLQLARSESPLTAVPQAIISFRSQTRCKHLRKSNSHLAQESCIMLQLLSCDVSNFFF